MTNEELKEWVRIYAVEILTVNHFAISCLANAPKDPLALVAALRQQMIGGVRNLGFPGVDPAMSDLASAELEDALNRLMEMVSAQISVVLDDRIGSVRGKHGVLLGLKVHSFGHVWVRSEHS